MADLAPRIWGIPVVASETDRDLLFPTPERDQRVQLRTSGVVQRYSGTGWVTDSPVEWNVLAFGAAGDGATDDLAAFQAAIAAAQAANRHAVFVPSRDYALSDTLTVPQGITLYGIETMGEYDGNAYTRGARLIRLASAAAATPVMRLSTSSACLGLELRYLKTGGCLRGILEVGGPAGTFITNARFKGAIRGNRSGNIDGVGTCYGIVFPDSADAKFFNDIDAYVTECDVSCWVGGLANANRIVLMSREAHLHLDLKGVAAEVIENDITLRAFAITALSPAYGIRRRKSLKNKVRGVYEAYGACFYADDGSHGNGNDDIDLVVNEATASYLPSTATDRRYAMPVNQSQQSQMYLPATTLGTRNVFGRGNKVALLKEVTGTLPWFNRPAGTLAAADGNVRSIVQFGDLFKKTTNLSFACRLRVYAYAPSNIGEHVADIDFLYRNTNQSTNAGELSVTRVVNKGGVITGLWFLSGVNGARNFGVALVGGGGGSNTSFERIAVSLEYEAITYSSNTVDMSALATVTFASTALDANDVLNGISLLTVADTAV